MDNYIDLSITTEYVPGWKFWQGVRELVQNAFDRERETEQGRDPVRRVFSDYVASITYDEVENVLYVENSDTTLGRNTLLLGAGSKRENGETIGQHGEGYKLAMLALVRDGHSVTLDNGQETWIPEIVQHETLESEILRVSFRDGDHGGSALRWGIHGVSVEQWELVQRNVRRLHDSGQELRGDGGWVLADPEESGRLYVGGLYVRDLHERFIYGYDFDPDRLHLDRDRTAVDSFDVAWECGRLLSDLGIGDVQQRLVLDAMQQTRKDVQYLLRHSTPLLEQVQESATKDFFDEYGQFAFPCSSEYEAKHVRENYAGINPVLVDEVMCQAIRSSKSWGQHIASMTKIERSLPADVLREFLDGHRKEFPQVLADAFSAELVDRAEEEQWKL